MDPKQQELEASRKILERAGSLGITGAGVDALSTAISTPVPQPQSQSTGVTTTDGIRDKIRDEGLPSDVVENAQDEDQFADIRESFKQTNDLVKEILSLQSPSEEEQGLGKEELALRQSLESMIEKAEESGFAPGGTESLEQMQAEISAIAGGKTRESLVAMRKLKQVQEQLNLARGNRETQLNVLKTAFDLTRQTTQDALAFYQLTAPQRVAIDSETGQVFFHNPITNEVFATDIEGFTPKNKFTEDLKSKYPDAGITSQDTEEEAVAKLPNSQIYQKQISQGGAGTGLITTIQGFDRERAIGNDFERFAADARTASRNISVVQEAFDSFEANLKEGEPLGAQSQAVITAFNKITDPTSVVRESEYARTPEGASLINRIEGYALRITQGGAGLEIEELQNIRDTALALYDGFEEQLIDFATKTVNQAQQLQIISGGQFGNLERILTPDIIELLEKAEEREFEPPPELEAIDISTNQGPNLFKSFWDGLKDSFK